MSRVTVGHVAGRIIVAILALVVVLAYIVVRALVHAVTALVGVLEPVWPLLAPVPKVAPAAAAVWLSYSVTDYLASGPELRRSVRQAWRVRFGWLRLAHTLQLVAVDRSPRLAMLRLRGYRSKQRKGVPKVLVPRIKIRADEYGVIVRARTRPGVGLEEWQEHAQHLADAWRCTRVAVTQAQPGRIVVRAVRLDPLTVPTGWVPSGAVPTADELRSWQLGRDEYAEQVALRLTNVPGLCVAGLPGSGKTSIINGFIARYAPSPAVQFAVLDGKAAGDYDDCHGRLFAYLGDDLSAANELLQRLVDLRRRRAAVIRDPEYADGMGVRNFWTTGPTDTWPLIVLIIDEAHTYFVEIKGNDAESKKLTALASENRRLVEDLVKKGRSLGFLTVLATQKSTGDSIPTSIRDVCPVLMSFAQTTAAAAVAALGEVVRDYPEADPVELQGPEFVGVASMKVEGRKGLTRVRMPHVQDDDVARVAAQTAQLTRDPADLLPARLSGVSDLLAP
jgi:S-DNA-T family DNA segregation ATPase FtsK/SpoIIIE